MNTKQEAFTSILSDGANIHRLNRTIAWSSFFFGAASGMVIGLWAFDGPVPAPASMTDYSATARRLLRLGHIAFFGIGYLNLLLAIELPSLYLSNKFKLWAAHAMNFANILLPVTLMAAAAVPQLKYLLPLPVSAATLALAIAAGAAFRRVYPVQDEPVQYILREELE